MGTKKVLPLSLEDAKKIGGVISWQKKLNMAQKQEKLWKQV